MKKVVLTTITPLEAEAIQQSERNYNTFFTLLQNVFISDEEKQIIAAKLSELQCEFKSLYKNLLVKYNVPYESNLRYRLSTNYEIFVEVY